MSADATTDISVVIPVFNAERYLERCIAGLLAQDYPADRIEILMVDNGSTDRSAELVRQYPRLIPLHVSRRGAYIARNHGITRASGRLIAFTDPDCVPEPHWLRRIAARFAAPELRLLLGPAGFDSTSYAARLLEGYEHQKELRIFSLRNPSFYWGHANNMTVRRDLFEQLGLFAERRRGADTMLVRRTAEAFGADAVSLEPGARVLHLEMDGLATYYRKSFTYGRSRGSYRSQLQIHRLPLRERTRLIRAAADTHRHPWLGVATLHLALTAGVLCYKAGALTALSARTVSGMRSEPGQTTSSPVER